MVSTKRTSGIRVRTNIVWILVFGLVIAMATGTVAGQQFSGPENTGVTVSHTADIAPLPTANTAEFRIYDNSEINSANDTIPAENNTARVWGGFSIINTPDIYERVLGRIRITLRGDAFVRPSSYPEYAVWNRTFLCWTFPASFVLNETLDWRTNFSFAADYQTSALVTVKNPVVLKRSVNRSLFVSRGYQFNSYEIRFVRNEFSTYSGRAAYEEKTYSNSSIINSSFRTDLPLTYLTNKSYIDPVDGKYTSEMNFGVNSSAVQLNRVYHFNFTADIRPRNNSGLPVRNYPRIFFALDRTGSLYPGANGITAVMPTALLPPHVSYAGAVTNVSNIWQYRHNTQVKLAFNQTAALIRPDYPGVFRPSDHTFYLQNKTGITTIVYGQATDLPVTGNWDGNGAWDVGVFRPASRTFLLFNGTTTSRVPAGFALPVDIPVTGDWNCDGVWEAGVFNKSMHQFRLKNGTSTIYISFGQNADLPVSGDWNGDCFWDVGVYNQSGHRFLLRNATGTTSVPVAFAQVTDLPVTGDWNSDLLTDIGVYRPSNQTFYMISGSRILQQRLGMNGDKPITGKWS